MLRDAIRIVGRRTAEVSDARRREALEATEAERAAARRHAEAMARAKQQCDVDSANLEADARFSLGSLARRITAADGGTALQTHAELTAKAERLAQRAKTHLAAQRCGSGKICQKSRVRIGVTAADGGTAL